MHVDGGAFWMGAQMPDDPDAFGDESPVHHVAVSPFLIGRADRFEAERADLRPAAKRSRAQQRLFAVLDGLRSQAMFDAFLVPNVLPLAVALDRGGVLLAVPPVIGVAGTPFLRNVQADQAVFGVCRHFLAVVIGAALALARGFAAYQLPWFIFRWLERSVTIAAAPFTHKGRCLIELDQGAASPWITSNGTGSGFDR